MQFKSSILPCVLFVVLIAGWILFGLPQDAHTGSLAIRAADAWKESKLVETLKEQKRFRAVKIVATVETVRDTLHLVSDIQPGDTMTGVYVFDSKSRNFASNPTSGVYHSGRAPAGIYLRAGSHRFGSNPDNVDLGIHIENFDSGNQFTLISVNNTCQPSLENHLGAATIGQIWWCLHDFKGSALADDRLPAGALELDDWQSLVGLRIEGTATDAKSGDDCSFLIAAKVVRTENIEH